MPVSGKTQGHIILSGSPPGLVVLTHGGAVYILMRDLLFTRAAPEPNGIVASRSLRPPVAGRAIHKDGGARWNGGGGVGGGPHIPHLKLSAAGTCFMDATG